MRNIDQRYWLAALVLLLLISFVGGMKYGDLKQSDPAQEIVEPATGIGENGPVETGEVKVYICGEVESPGLYKLKAGSRVYDALKIAGILPGADLKTVQPARKLQDGETIELLAEGQNAAFTVPPGPVSNNLVPVSGTSSSSTGQININTASVQELDDRLPGIGPTLAQRIIDYRTNNGPFTTIDDINNVSGIGDKKFADIKDLITVR